jgi:hypothetical protein
MARSLGKLPAQERAWRTQTDKPMSGYELHRLEEG